MMASTRECTEESNEIPPRRWAGGASTHGDAVFAEQVRQLYSGLSYSTVVTIIVGAMLVYAQSAATAGHIMAGWAIYMVVALVLRGLLGWRFTAGRALEKGHLAVWLHRYMAGVAAMGAGWGAAGVLFYPPDSSPHQFVTAFVLAAAAGGGMALLTPVYSACVVFMTLTLAPITLGAAIRGGEYGALIAMMCAVLLVFALLFSRRQHVVLLQSLTLGIENAALAEKLTEQMNRAEYLNADLRQKEDTLARAQRIAGVGSWEWDIVKDEIRGSEETYRIFAIDRDVPFIKFGQFIETVHPDERELVTEAVRASIEEGAPYSIEHRAILPDGEIRVLLQQGELSLDEGGRPLRMTGVTHDITARYRMEEDLREASYAAEVASRAKSQFLANMSHELRTPLNAIIGYSELLREDAEEQGETAEVADLDRIAAAGQHLLSLVNEVLDLSKIEAGKTELATERFDLHRLVEEVVATVTPMIGKNGNRMNVDCPADIGPMQSDATKLRQVLFNLLSNAAKFTSGGDIGLSVARQGSDLGPDNPGNMVFTVSDTGHGIAPDQVEAAFTAFEQTDSSDAAIQGGTGLGLPISRHFCALMGGTISVESEIGKGSTFTVRLPAEIGVEILPALRKGDATA